MIGAFLLGHWRALGTLALVLLLAGYIETLRIERDHAYAAEATAKAALATFKAEVAALGEKAKVAAAAQEDADKLRKEQADAENSSALATLARTVGELRKSRPGSSFVPQAPRGSASPDRITFDRPEFERATRSLVEGVRGLADEGATNTVKLNTGRRWAAGLKLSTTISSP